MMSLDNFLELDLKNTERFVVKILESDNELKKDELYLAKKYLLDPDKFTLLSRLSDNFDLERNVYRYQVKIMQKI